MSDPRDPRSAQHTGTVPRGDGSNTHSRQVGTGDEGATPRLPNEHDESSDQQKPAGPQSASVGGIPDVGKKALADVERGVVDTSRAEATDRTYKDMKRKPD